LTVQEILGIFDPT